MKEEIILQIKQLWKRTTNGINCEQYVNSIETHMSA